MRLQWPNPPLSYPSIRAGKGELLTLTPGEALEVGYSERNCVFFPGSIEIEQIGKC